MRFYNFDTKFTFGKYEGKTLQEVIEIQPSYIEWCAINLDHFCISEEIVTEINSSSPYFKLSDEAMGKLDMRYMEWVDKQEYYDYRGGDCQKDYHETWGQERGLCDCVDNCYGCPHAPICF